MFWLLIVHLMFLKLPIKILSPPFLKLIVKIKENVVFLKFPQKQYTSTF